MIPHMESWNWSTVFCLRENMCVSKKDAGKHLYAMCYEFMSILTVG